MKRTCPMCKKEVVWKDNPWKPFCSKRCKMVDLGFWAMGEYKVAGEKVSKESMEERGDENEEKGDSSGSGPAKKDVKR